MKFLKSKSIQMRLITANDAKFILKLRLDPKYNKHLSIVTSDLEEQIKWIMKYKNDENLGKQFYFIIERLDGTACGAVRLYDFTDESFCWGSWILSDEYKTQYAALESTFLVYKFGFEELNFKKCHFDVRKQNKLVVSYHKKLGAVVVDEDMENFYFEITSEVISFMNTKYKKILY